MGSSVFPGWLVRQATITLTDTQIKALPTAGGVGSIQVVAAPGANRILIFLSGLAILNTTAGSYMSLDGASCVMQISYGAAGDSAATDASNFIDQNNGPSFFDAGGIVFEQWIPIAYDDGSGSLIANGGVLGTSYANKGLKVTAFNGVTGAFTGGNAANTMTIAVQYSIYNTVTKMFE